MVQVVQAVLEKSPWGASRLACRAREAEELLPVDERPGRPRRWTLRQLIDGIRFRVRTGCPWRDVPERYGSWQSVYGLFRAWQLARRVGRDFCPGCRRPAPRRG
jgi:transposase